MSSLGPPAAGGQCLSGAFLSHPQDTLMTEDGQALIRSLRPLAQNNNLYYIIVVPFSFLFGQLLSVAHWASQCVFLFFLFSSHPLVFWFTSLETPWSFSSAPTHLCCFPGPLYFRPLMKFGSQSLVLPRSGQVGPRGVLGGEPVGLPWDIPWVPSSPGMRAFLLARHPVFGTHH